MENTDKSTSQLVAESIEDAAKLFRLEGELLKDAIVEGVVERMKGVAAVLIAVVLVVPGLLFLVMSGALALPFSPWLDFLVASIVLLGLAALGAWLGVRKIKAGGPGSRAAMDKVKEDARWVRDRVK
ncbi:MAG TPA: phage holin family protein [Actinomycetota bacterium]